VVSALGRATFGPLLLALECTLWQHGKDTSLARVAPHGRGVKRQRDQPSSFRSEIENRSSR
jgi:hypothetical protein